MTIVHVSLLALAHPPCNALLHETHVMNDMRNANTAVEDTSKSPRKHPLTCPALRQVMHKIELITLPLVLGVADNDQHLHYNTN